MINSFIEGRVRLRFPLLTDAAFAEHLRAGLLRIGGVLKVDVNTRTCGLLLEYDKDRLPIALLKGATPLLLRIDDLKSLPAEQRISELDAILEALADRLVVKNTFTGGDELMHVYKEARCKPAEPEA